MGMRKRRRKGEGGREGGREGGGRVCSHRAGTFCTAAAAAGSRVGIITV